MNEISNEMNTSTNTNKISNEMNTSTNKISNEMNDKFNLITKNLAETIDINNVYEKLSLGMYLKAYIGVEPTNIPSLEYLILLLKVRDLAQADVDIVIFLADVHAFLNKGKQDRIIERTTYYEFLTELILNSIGLPKDGNYRFVHGSDVQLDKKYILDLFKATTIISISKAKHAGSEVLKQNNDPKLSELIYPVMQVLDETCLGVDIQLGGLNQKKIFALSRDIVTKLDDDYKKCTYLMTYTLPSLNKPSVNKQLMNKSSVGGWAMNKSSVDRDKIKSKINFFDTFKEIKTKIDSAYCIERDCCLDTSPCLALAKYIVFPIVGNIGSYKDFTTLLLDWKDGKYSVYEFKLQLVNAIEFIIAPIRNEIQKNQDLYELAYGIID